MIPALLAAAMTTQGAEWIGKTRYFGARDDQAVYEVKQDNVVLDFKGGSILSGKPVNPDQSTYTGTGLLIEGRKNVTIRNLTVKGYRFNIKIKGCANVRLENVHIGGSRSIRMARDGRPINTFLDIRDYFRWQEYGAGIYMEDTHGVVVKKCTGKGSQNGLMMLHVSDATIIENDFSYNSGWGIALCRSFKNRIVWNKADFCNRPWAGGWGGDSAGIAMVDGSMHNYVVGNSLTHSGDGFFLTHRNDRFLEDKKVIELVNTSNENVVAYNDGSWSTANAFEGTFSNFNVYYKNWANDSLAAGFWLGYSNESLVLENEILRNQNSGVAIEHGTRNVILRNRIEKSGWAGVALYAADDWRATAKPSKDNDSMENRLVDNGQVYNLHNTYNPYLSDQITQPGPGNYASAANPSVKGVVERFQSSALPEIKKLLALRPKGWKFYRETGAPKGVQWLQTEDWAPRDFSRALAAWRQPDPGSLELYLTTLGCRVAAPAIVQFDPTPDDPMIVRISARANASEVGRDQEVGITIGSRDGKRKQLVKATLRTCTWQVDWFDWNGLSYQDADAWTRLFAGKSLLSQTTRLLGGDYTGKSPGAGVPNHHFACVARTKFRSEGGRYIFSTLSDDGIRVLVDGKEIISRWNHHGPTPDEEAVTLAEGVHDIRVEYCQESGAAVLRVDWRKSG